MKLNERRQKLLKKIVQKGREITYEKNQGFPSMQFPIPFLGVWRSKANSRFMTYSTKDFNLVWSRNSRKLYAGKPSIPGVYQNKQENQYQKNKQKQQKTDHKIAEDPLYPPPHSSQIQVPSHHGLAPRRYNTIQENKGKAFSASFQK